MSVETPGPAELTAFARQVMPVLDGYSYYQLLRVPVTADTRAIRASYYKIAAQLHPDRYFGILDSVTREQLETIYARVCEAYRVLTNSDKRAQYDESLKKGARRYETRERAASGPQNPEDTLAHPQAKKFFRMGMVCLGRKDYNGATLNFNFAKTFEPTARAILDKLAEVAAVKKSGSPSGGASSSGSPPGSPSR
jgi:curved DNA-binding protein CbpA